MILRERLAQAVGEHDLAVGQMAQDVAGAPFSRRTRRRDARRTDAADEAVQFERRGLDHLARFARADMNRIGIRNHRSRPLSTLSGWPTSPRLRRARKPDTTAAGSGASAR